METGSFTCDIPSIQTFHLAMAPPTLVKGKAYTILKEGILFLVNQLDIGEIKEVDLKPYFIPLVHNPINIVLKDDLALKNVIYTCNAKNLVMIFDNGIVLQTEMG